MLRNRFLRFLTTVLMGVALLLVALWVEENVYEWGWKLPDAATIGVVLFPFAVCIVGQFFGDIMNVDTLFNNGFVTLLKRLVFFAVALFALLFGMAILFDGSMDELLETGGSFFEFGLCAAWAYSPAIALFCYVLEYTVFTTKKERMPMYFPISVGAGLVLGMVTGLIITLAGLQETASIIIVVVELLIAVAAFMLCFREEWPFNEDGYAYSSYSSSGRSSYSPSTYSRDDDEEDRRGICSDCAYYRSIKDPAYNNMFNDPTSHYCAYSGEVIEGMFHEGHSCDGFKKR